MYLFRNAAIENHKYASLIHEFIEWGNTHPHEICRCDGTWHLYWSCRGIESGDFYISKYGERYGHSLVRLKRWMRRIGRELERRNENH